MGQLDQARLPRHVRRVPARSRPIFARPRCRRAHCPAAEARADGCPRRHATIVGHRYDVACHHLRDFLARNRIVFPLGRTRRGGRDRPDEVPSPPQHGRSLSGGGSDPRVAELVTKPTLRELAEGLKLQTVPRRGRPRRGDRRRRAHGARRSGVWCIGRVGYAAGRTRSARRASRHVIAYRELSRLSHRRCRATSSAARALAASQALRRRAPGRALRSRDRARRRATAIMRSCSTATDHVHARTP